MLIANFGLTMRTANRRGIEKDRGRNRGRESRKGIEEGTEEGRGRTRKEPS